MPAVVSIRPPNNICTAVKVSTSSFECALRMYTVLIIWPRGGTDDETDEGAAIERMRAPAACRQQRDPQRRGCIEDRGLVGRHVLHGDVSAAVGDEHVTDGHHEHVAPLGGVEGEAVTQRERGE